MPIRIRATADTDGELHLRGLAICKGEVAEVIGLTEGSSDQDVLALLQRDQTRDWIFDPAESIYTEDDLR